MLARAFGEIAPVTPLLPNMLVTEPLPYVIGRSIGVCGGDVYARQVRRGNVVFGGGGGWLDATREFARPSSDQSLEGMMRTLSVLPGLAQAHIIRTWSGVDGQMPDNIPVIGFSGTEQRLIHAFGFSGHGFQLGPVVGQIIAELVTKGESETPIEPFSIRRFADWSGADIVANGHVEH
jgi:sarcosine oxidase subunit beta